MTTKKYLLLFVILGLFAVSGCKGPKVKGLVPVRGTIIFNDEPLEGASVGFTPKEFKAGDRLATGKTDSQGRFELRTIGELGVLPGEYVVVVIKNEISPGKQTPPIDSKPDRPKPVQVKSLIPKRYGDPKTSDLNVIVGQNGIRDLQLEIPISFRYVLRPSTHFMLQPYAGLIFNFALYGTIKPPPVSWMIGFQYGVKAGPGIFFIDPRFSMDITQARLNELYGRVEFNRIKMYIGAGYKISFW